MNASYTRLPEYITELLLDDTLLVHCQTGRRTAAASAFLKRQGATVKFVNDTFASYDSTGA